MKTYDYNKVELVAHHDVAMGKLVVFALLDGVEVPLAAHKMGHYAHLLKEGREKRLEAEAKANEAKVPVGTPEPIVPHDVTGQPPVTSPPPTSPTQ